MRLLIGEALGRRDECGCSSWGIRKPSTTLGLTRREAAQREATIEAQVSRYIRAMPFVWVEVPDDPGPSSARSLIERNVIGLLSNHSSRAIDPPSETWLGRLSGREKVRLSGLWNNKHVDEGYDPGFLEVLREAVERTTPID